MLLTEEEARKANCIGPANCGKKQRFHGHDFRYCEGSLCKMAWRRAEPVSWQEGALKQYRTAEEAEAAGMRTPAKGYCGLAGKPE